MKSIQLGTVKVPIENYATQANAILGIKGSGKTTTAKVIAEQLLDAGIPIVVIDPVGMWRYLKVPKEKGGKAYKVVVAGGQAGDLPLTPHTAPEILRSAMRSNIPLVIDLYDIKLSKTDWRRIVQSACQILMFENKGIRHVFLEEAAEYIPQVVRDGEVYSAVEKLCRMGGNASVGITLINPRAQEVNKAVLELCELLILQRQKGSHAMAAIDKWLTMAQDVKGVAKTIASLAAGEALVWPESSEPVRTQFPNCATFHPDRKKPDLPKGSIPENVTEFVDALRANLGNIEAELKANDPAELKRKVAELERKLKAAEQKSPEVKQSEPVCVEVPVFSGEAQALLQNAIIGCEMASGNLEVWAVELAKVRSAITQRIAAAQPHVRPFIRNRVEKPRAGRICPKCGKQPGFCRCRFESAPTKPSESNGDVSKCEAAILGVLNSHGDCTIGRLSLLSGYTQSGSFKNALSSLRTRELIQGENRSVMSITAMGAAHGPFPPVPSTPDERISYWMAFPHFGKCDREVIQVLWDAGKPMTMDQIAEAANYEVPVSGSFKNSLSNLRTAGVLVGRNQDAMSLNPTLFE